MDENLVGYLLKALDSDTERETESYLRTSSDGRAKLELLRRALAPLASDREELSLPADLRVRTLRLVAENRGPRSIRMPQAPRTDRAMPVSWWRRADVLVAASLLLVCLPFILPLLASAQRSYKRLSCENNLRGMFQALTGYTDLHEGDLPKVEQAPPRNFAGVYAPILYRDGLLNGVSLSCPGRSSPAPQAVSPEDLARIYETDRPRFEQLVREAGGCYAYTLGYRDGGQLCGLRRVVGESDQLPVMADRPPFERSDDPGVFEANSRNHNGLGQNVLYLGGNVRWAVNRNAGPHGKDIYLNSNGELKAGLNRWDTVLAASGVRPENEPAPEH